MNNDLFIPIKFKTTISLMPNEMDKNFEKNILTKIKSNLENVCSKYGFIKKDSIKVIKRSVGCFKQQHFNGNIIFNIQCVAEICNPAQGSIIKCKVKAKNSLGILAEGYYDNMVILQIIIPKISAGIQSEINIDTVNVGDEVKIEVCGKKYQLFDKNISIIGRIIKDKDEIIKNIIDEDEDIVLDDEEEDEDILNIKLDDEDDDKKIGGEDDDEDIEDDEEEDDEEDFDDEVEEDGDIEDEFGADDINGGDD